eukprot:1157097-Pelagomonas_calceolata.AAC.2
MKQSFCKPRSKICQAQEVWLLGPRQPAISNINAEMQLFRGRSFMKQGKWPPRRRERCKRAIAREIKVYE